MKTSARNQFYGEVVQLEKGAVNAEVVLRIDGGEYISAIITNKSVKDLRLKEGCKAWALIRASSVVLILAEESIKTSARNQFFGKITHCQEGAVNGEVTVESEGGNTVTAIITNETIRELGLQEGVSAGTLVKAANVMIAVKE